MIIIIITIIVMNINSNIILIFTETVSALIICLLYTFALMFFTYALWLFTADILTFNSWNGTGVINNIMDLFRRLSCEAMTVWQ